MVILTCSWLFCCSFISSPLVLRRRGASFATAITQKSLLWTPRAWRSFTHWSPRSAPTGSAPWASSDLIVHKVGRGAEVASLVNGRMCDFFFFFFLVQMLNAFGETLSSTNHTALKLFILSIDPLSPSASGKLLLLEFQCVWNQLGRNQIKSNFLCCTFTMQAIQSALHKKT